MTLNVNYQGQGTPVDAWYQEYRKLVGRSEPRATCTVLSMEHRGGYSLRLESILEFFCIVAECRSNPSTDLRPPVQRCPKLIARLAS